MTYQTDFKKLEKEITGKTILVTGASSGIGYAFAELLGNFNAKIILVARNEEKLNELASLMNAKKAKAFVKVCDLSDEEAVNRLISEVNAEFEKVDILVNNAGRSIRREVAKSYERLHDFRRMMAINYFGAIGLILGFLPAMEKSRSGQVINVLSWGVQFRGPQFAAYNASKSALDTATRCFAAEMANRGVAFSNIYMPLVKTPMIAPTEVYKDEKAWTPEQAADSICEAIITKKASVTTSIGFVFDLMHTLLPKKTFKLMNQFFRKEKNKEKEMSGLNVTAE